MTAKYDTIGINYNSTRKADPYLADRLYHHLSPTPSGRYLDIGCGTGNYTIALHQRGVNITGIDPSETMLTTARQRNPDILWHQGNAQNTGLDPSAVDGITAFLTIHHWEDPDRSFAEMYRILKPGGKMVIFTSTPTQMKGYWLNHYFPEMMDAGIRQMPSLEVVKEAMTGAGFSISATEPYSVKPGLQDLFLYSGKYNPGLYFRPEIRNGISTFSALAHKKEVETGLAQLQQDINTGKIEEVINSYENKNGDYLYVTGRKPEAIPPENKPL